ncbi:MAG: hypothetical protein ACE5WD_07450 [Candidatus Aminicenantia bacterium]
MPKIIYLLVTVSLLFGTILVLLTGKQASGQEGSLSARYVKCGVAVFRPSNRMWYFDSRHNGTTDTRSGPWGLRGDLPIAGDFDRDKGDRVFDDVGVFRPSTRMWYYDYDHNGTTDDRSGPWGQRGDIPIVGDFDRDCRADDVAVKKVRGQIFNFEI